MKKFANQFLAIFVGLFLLLSLGVVFYTNYLVRETTLQTLLVGVEKRAHNIGQLLDEWILQNANNVQTAVEDFRSLAFLLEEQDSVAFLNNEGTLIYSSNAYLSSAENQSNTKEIRSVLNGFEMGNSGITTNRDGISEYRVAVPLYNGKGEQIGIFRLSHRLSELDQLEKDATQSVFVFSFISIALASFIAIYLTRRISKPLKQIESVINRISEGDYSEHYIGTDYPEIMDLGYTVNELSERLEEKNQEIVQSNDRLNAILDRLIIGVVLLDSEQKIQLMNPAVQNILGITDEQLGHSFLEMSKSYGLVQIIQKTYQQKASQNEEIYIYYPQERVIDVNTVLLPDDKKNQVIVLLYDLTEIRRLEKVRTDFVTNASHELRTPVTALKGFAEVLLDGAMDNPIVTKQFLEIIYKESKRLEVLVNDILELSRVEQKQVPMKQEEITLQEVVMSCFQVIQSQADEKNIGLRLHSNTPKAIKIQGDRSRLEQVLNNLIYNALTYTDKGGKVSVLLEEKDNEVNIHVADTGIGIPEEDLSRIFERFYRVDKARSRNSGGTGLGLSIVRYLVQNMNGTLSVKSTLGMGSTFTVRLFRDGWDHTNDNR